MSSGKKKYPKKRMYSEGEVRRAIREASDQAVARIMLLCIVASRDMFHLDENGVNEFMETMARYIDYEKKGLVSLDDASNSLKKQAGIDLRLTRW